MDAIRKKMLGLKASKEASADMEKQLQNRLKELNVILKARDDEILQLGKKTMQIENKLDDAIEGNLKAVLELEEAEKQQLINEEDVSSLQRRCSLLETDMVTTENRLSVETTKLAEAASAAESVELQRKTLESRSMVNDERIDSLDEQILVAQGVAYISTRNAEEASRKLSMTQVELDRTNEKSSESESKIQELEEQLNVVGQNMKTLELSETNALKRHEEFEEKIRDLTLNLKFTEIQASAAERESAKLQKELDALQIELNDWKEKYGEICTELEQTFNEMAGY